MRRLPAPSSLKSQTNPLPNIASAVSSISVRSVSKEVNAFSMSARKEDEGVVFWGERQLKKNWLLWAMEATLKMLACAAECAYRFARVRVSTSASAVSVIEKWSAIYNASHEG